MTRRYALLLHGDEGVWEALDARGRASALEDHAAFAAAVDRCGRLVGAHALAGAATATTVRRDGSGGLRLHDGAYDGRHDESAQVLGGIYVVDVPDLDAATGLCGTLPTGYVVEVRPVLSPDPASW